MDIVILDGHTTNPGDLNWDPIASQGALTVYDRTAPEQIIPRIGKAQAIFTNKTPLDRSVFDACPDIQFVGVLATGYNIVDLDAARDRRVTVCNVPGYSTPSVAQMTFALLLELCHRAGRHSDTVHSGRWRTCPDFTYWDFPLVELAGKTMGIVGYGDIGQQVARLARAFGMEVLACGGRRPVVSDGVVAGTGLEEVFTRSDVISLHCPLTEASRGMINRDSIARMKDGVLLLNTARGPLIVESDLRAALDSGKVGGAGLDVLCQEPPRDGSPLLGATNCILTPHIAWAPREARQRLVDTAAENLAAWRAGRPIHVVT
ncbi:D-2-hydroxyacid dehydrogenase [Lawsonibacter celer]|uniref:D-2-hydroxyacid dehydrogenase n=1 Tax=Lawsonibacter celer TaxID=2986526 RepID=UPI001647AFB8|nr:D-2-hydroxyacid dehydrogenase [Lawsonibacter celer]